MSRIHTNKKESSKNTNNSRFKDKNYVQMNYG